jgi:hypothetical protein
MCHANRGDERAWKKCPKNLKVRARNDLKHHHERGKLNPTIHNTSKMENGQCGTPTEATRGARKKCPENLEVRARNDLKHHHERGKLNPAIYGISKMGYDRCGTQTEVTRCRDTMLILVLVRARNDLKHHHGHGNMNPAVHMVRKTEVIRTPEWSKEITKLKNGCK